MYRDQIKKKKEYICAFCPSHKEKIKLAFSLLEKNKMNHKDEK